jgi:predicted enzyme related to lactoylglutathione lyase
MFRDSLTTRFAIALTVIGLLLAAGCQTLQLRLPAVTDQPTGTRIPGKIVWRDLITHTPEASKAFYARLFGWEYEEVGIALLSGNSIGYTLIRHEGRLIGGMIDANGLGRPDPSSLSQWVILMSVPDIDAAVRSAEQNGGVILTPPTDVAERGRLALVEDPQGAALALVQTRDGDPADADTPMGGFLWDEIWAEDVTQATTFYRALSGLETGNESIASGVSYRYLSGSGQARFGILQNPVEGLDPTWVTYIRVDDPVQITAQVEALGGHVLAPPRERDLGGQVALIADPSGAGIAIQTWPIDRDFNASNGSQLE